MSASRKQDEAGIEFKAKELRVWCEQQYRLHQQGPGDCAPKQAWLPKKRDEAKKHDAQRGAVREMVRPAKGVNQPSRLRPTEKQLTETRKDFEERSARHNEWQPIQVISHRCDHA